MSSHLSGPARKLAEFILGLHELRAGLPCASEAEHAMVRDAIREAESPCARILAAIRDDAPCACEARTNAACEMGPCYMLADDPDTGHAQ